MRLGAQERIASLGIEGVGVAYPGPEPFQSLAKGSEISD